MKYKLFFVSNKSNKDETELIMAQNKRKARNYAFKMWPTKCGYFNFEVTKASKDYKYFIEDNPPGIIPLDPQYYDWSHALLMKKLEIDPASSVDEFVDNYPRKHEWGFDSEELHEILEFYPTADKDRIFDRLRGDTCMLTDDNKIIRYPYDVKYTILEGLNVPVKYFD